MSARRPKVLAGVRTDDPRRALREHLIDVTEQLLHSRGPTGLTTREIARHAGVSDGVLYNHFADKHSLVLAALARRFASLADHLRVATPQPGTASVEDNLACLCEAALDFHRDLLPLMAGVLSEPALLHRFLDEIHHGPTGPQHVEQVLADYLRAERRLGRIRPDADPEAAAALLVGACHTRAMASLFTSGTSAEVLGDRVRGLVRTLITGLGTCPGEADASAETAS